jgi:hypothetical protein
MLNLIQLKNKEITEKRFEKGQTVESIRNNNSALV